MTDQPADKNPETPDEIPVPESVDSPVTPSSDETPSPSSGSALPDATAPTDVDAALEASLQAMESAAAPAPSSAEAADEKSGTADEQPQGEEGVIVRAAGSDVFVELGPRRQGVVPMAEFSDPPRLGDKHRYAVIGEDDDLLQLTLIEGGSAGRIGGKLEKGAIVNAKVIGANIGGLDLRVGKVEAFMPASHIDVDKVDNFNDFLNETFACAILEVQKRGRRKRLLLSRRVVVAKQNRKSAAGFIHTVSPGQIIKGVVKRFESFGAFVEVHPGVEGLLHVSNISRSRVERPEDKLTLGQELELAILDVKDRGRRIGLGLKQLEPDPWDDINSRYDVNAVLEGRVQRITKFGVFVELEPGLEGLIHVSQMSAGRGGRMEDMVKVGSDTAVRVLSIDENEQRVALSRLDESGRIIGDDGSEPVADPSPVKRSKRREPAPKVLRSDDPAASGGGINLGDLLRRALDDD